MNDHIAIGQHEETKLFHSMFYRNVPTPSGCPRPILKLSTSTGYETKEEALEVMKKAFTEEALEKIDLPDLSA